MCTILREAVAKALTADIPHWIHTSTDSSESIHVSCPELFLGFAPQNVGQMDVELANACEVNGFLSALPLFLYRAALMSPRLLIPEDPLTLNPINLRRILEGGERLRGIANAVLSISFNSVPVKDECRSPAECLVSARKQEEKWLAGLLSLRFHWFVDCAPEQSNSTSFPMCHTCTSSVERHWRATQVSVLKELPRFFGLIGWAELRERDRQFQADQTSDEVA
jgi:hypothetical protein